jgi:hypothetical protein
MLLAMPAAVHFLSMEPLIERVVLPLDAKVNWIIIGGESGTGARPFDINWARELVTTSRKLGASPFVKQMGMTPVESGIALKDLEDGSKRFQPATRALTFKDSHGGEPDEWPIALQVREFPRAR